MSAAPSPYKNRMIESALWYATNMGWSVFPCHSIGGGRCTCSSGLNCKSPGKHPRWMKGSLEHGCASATTDKGVIRTWWTKWPDAHIGMATGAASGAWVVDEDPRHGGDGSRCALEQKYDRLPDTLQSVTGSKGSHRFFLHPGLKVKNEVAIAPGLDIRGDGGLVILPPSGHISGNTYEWDGLDGIKAPIANAPQWLLELVCESPGARKPPQQIPEIIPDGTKHKTCVSLAGSMRWRGCNADEIYAALLQLSERFESPVPDKNLWDIAADIEGRYSPETPSMGAQPWSRPDPQPKTTAGIPRICANGRQLRDISNDALSALQAVNHPPELFSRGNIMVAIILDEKGRKMIAAVGESALRGRLARSANYYKVNSKGDPYDCVPPVEVVKDILALQPADWKVPSLQGLVEAPVLRPNGTILDTPGYDPPTGLYYAPDPDLQIPEIPTHPTSDHIDAALSLITDDVLVDFPFIDEASKANAIAGMLTPIVKSAIDAPTPLQLNDAPQAGTGKSLGAEVVSIISTGRPAEMFSAPKDEDEWRKQITTALLSGTRVVVFDNISRRLDSGELCKALTATQYADREFRTHEKILLPVSAIFIATGNNVQLGGDMPRRCYHVRLDAKQTRPFLRTGFKHPDLKAWVVEHRGELLAALLTLARAWYVAGKPKPNMPPLGGFEAWSITIGGILEHVGVSGFLGNAISLYEAADQESVQWEGFLLTLHDSFYNEPFTAAQIMEKLHEKTATERTNSLRTALPDFLAEAIDREGFFQRRAGRCFAERLGKRFGESGVHLKRGSVVNGRQHWEVVVC